MVCSASPMGMTADDRLPLDPDALDPSMYVGDVIAGHGITPFVKAAQAAGCRPQEVDRWSRQCRS
ncbi:MAG: shikimate dehydrogenase [Mycobacterium sp.]|nr:shikimate dehydrogenase [Mycobacterium sp.]